MITTETATAPAVEALTFNASIPADIVKALPSRTFRIMFERIGAGHAIATTDLAIHWIDDREEEYLTVDRGTLSADAIARAKLGLTITGTSADVFATALSRTDSGEPVDISLSSANWARSLDSTDETSTRFTLGGVAITKGGAAVSTDGRCLQVLGPLFDSEVVGVIPADTIKLVRKLAGAKGSIQCRIWEKVARFIVRTKTAERIVWTRLIEGRFPKWDQVLPTGNILFSGQFNRPTDADISKAVKVARLDDKDGNASIFVGPSQFDIELVAIAENGARWESFGVDRPIQFHCYLANETDSVRQTLVVMPLAFNRKDKAAEDKEYSRRIAAWESIVSEGRESVETVDQRLARIDADELSALESQLKSEPVSEPTVELITEPAVESAPEPVVEPIDPETMATIVEALTEPAVETVAEGAAYVEFTPKPLRLTETIVNEHGVLLADVLFHAADFLSKAHGAYSTETLKRFARTLATAAADFAK